MRGAGDMRGDKLKQVLLHRDIVARTRSYVLLLTVAGIGAAAGLLAPAGVFGASPADIGPYLESYLSCLPLSEPAPGREFFSFLKWNGALLLALLLCGLYAAGSAFVPALLFMRAFTFAFADYYLACSHTVGAAALLISVLLPQLLSLLACIRAAREALDMPRSADSAPFMQRPRWQRFIAALLICLPAMLIAASLQAWFVPLVLRLAYG